MIAHFTLIPLGTKDESLSKVLAKAVQNIDESGLDYKIGAMGTTIEGDWYEVMTVINRCRKTILRECPRVEISIFLDDRKDVTGQMKNKVTSLEKKLGKKLKK